MANLLQRNENLDWEKVRKSISAYSDSTGVGARIIDEKGEPIHITNCENAYYTYCELFRNITGNPAQCREVHLNSSCQAEKLGEAFVSVCPGGLVHWAVPLIVSGCFKGALVGGPVLLDPIDEDAVKEIVRSNKLAGKHKDTLKKFLSGIKVIDRKKVRYYAELLLIAASDLIQHETKIFRERREFYLQQAKLSEEIQNLRNDLLNDKKQDFTGYYYDIEKEKELIRKVKMGDKIGAKTILNEILGQIFFLNADKLPVIRARILELVVILSRAAVEGGAHLEMVMGLNFKYIQEFSTLNSIEEISFWLVKVLEKFTEMVFTVGNVKNYEIIQKALDCIRENYNKDMSLEDVAKVVYLSTGYFSRLFKEEVGVNFSDYLARVRIEESKKYLSMLSMSMLDVAQEVGYQDQSYYTKVFKKIEGISPGQFRKNNWKI